jgi:hypothetical protein
MRLEIVQKQRTQAFSSCLLAMCIAGGVFASVYGSTEVREIAAVREEVSIHEGLWRNSERDLHKNESTLAAVRAALGSLKPKVR